ncbi:hypothetical protein TNCV_3859361 [Trichonephila clavipes]|nr:hypothetical protein TNCV_3859361 [Trichonephila clavipes]
MSDASSESFILAVTEDIPKFDIGPNVSQPTPAKVKRLLSTYASKKRKTANIELDIALTHDKPIFQRNCRLPFAEQNEMDASIDGLGAVIFQKFIHDNQFHHVFYM